MAPIINGTLVKLERSDGNPCIQTYCRRHGRSYQRFFIDAKKFAAWIHRDDDTTTYYDRDIWSYLSAWKSGDMIRFRVTWLTSGDNLLHGYEQTVALPVSMIKASLESNGSWQYLYVEKSRQPMMDFSRAGNTIRHITGNKQLRRAFSKGIGKNFQWRDSRSITFYNETPHGSLFFEENDGRGICGGFILHRGVEKTKSGNYDKVYYSVHT